MSYLTRKKKKSIKKPGPEQCHPSVGRVKPAIGCLPLEVLERAGQKLNLSGSGVRLRRQLESALNVKGAGENTFLKALPLSDSEKNSLRAKYLRPPQPAAWLKDPDTWLDSTNISAVMNQYEESNPEFEFMGPYPIDFGAPNPYGGISEKQCLINEMCALSVANAEKNGTKMIGIVYNLDPHFKGGSHWVANFIDLSRKECIYFDSYGMKTPPQIEKFMKWLTTNGPGYKLHYSSRRLQYKNTECGMYSIYFIAMMLSGCSLIEVSRSKPTDADMLSLRSWMFST
jgi:hypothetical protein